MTIGFVVTQGTGLPSHLDARQVRSPLLVVKRLERRAIRHGLAHHLRELVGGRTLDRLPQHARLALVLPNRLLALNHGGDDARLEARIRSYELAAKMQLAAPEALDLLSRALRAGHAFQTAMGMVADEMRAPVGPEFKRMFDQQNFGLPLREAMTELTERVPLVDVKFFATAVAIQRDTGGNLAEILDNLAHVVRERFKILRQVRVHTAHGRFTGYVLLALPAALGVALSFINPEHMDLLFRERMGQMMIVGAIVMQTIGYFWIRKVIKIEV